MQLMWYRILKDSVPFVLFIHIYFEAFLKVNTLDSIISKLLMSGTSTSIPHPCTL